MKSGLSLAISFSLSEQMSTLEGKAFAPLGANAFPSRVDPIWKGYIIQESKQEVTKVVPLCKKRQENMEVYQYTSAVFAVPTELIILVNKNVQSGLFTVL